jgi:hypothetical protein
VTWLANRFVEGDAAAIAEGWAAVERVLPRCHSTEDGDYLIDPPSDPGELDDLWTGLVTLAWHLPAPIPHTHHREDPE